MERRVEKIQDCMAEDPIQMVTEGVAHDFRNLLEAIRSRATMAKNLTGSVNRPQDLMYQIVQLIDQNSHVVDFLEQFADTRKCQKQVVDLNSVVEMILERARIYLPDIALASDLLDRSIPVAVDAEKISQAAGVFLENAYYALPERQGVISVSTEIVSMVNGSCEFYGLPSGEYARLTVADNGAGMEKDVLTQVFTPYYTKDNGWHAARKGIGLTLAQNIVDSHGGTIDVWSTPGKGSAFSINLPLEKHAVEQDPFNFRAASPSVSPQKNTLLIVDDEPMVLDVMKSMVNALGYNALTAQNEIEAIQLYNENRDQIILVILDLNLNTDSGMNGAEFFYYLKGQDPLVNVVILTGSTMNGDIKNLLENGCIDCLQKPADLKDIQKILLEVAGI